jgi:hypothetical protein
MAKLSESDYGDIVREIEAACDQLKGSRSKHAQGARGRGEAILILLKSRVDSHGLDALPNQQLRRWAESLRYQAEQLAGPRGDGSRHAARALRSAADRLEAGAQGARAATK